MKKVFIALLGTAMMLAGGDVNRAKIRPPTQYPLN
jgi:hypothetical protein